MASIGGFLRLRNRLPERMVGEPQYAAADRIGPAGRLFVGSTFVTSNFGASPRIYVVHHDLLCIVGRPRSEPSRNACNVQFYRELPRRGRKSRAPRGSNVSVAHNL